MARTNVARLARLEAAAPEDEPTRLMWANDSVVAVMPQGWAIERQTDEPEDTFTARVAEAEGRSRLDVPDCADPLGAMLADIAAQGRRLGDAAWGRRGCVGLGKLSNG